MNRHTAVLALCVLELSRGSLPADILTVPQRDVRRKAKDRRAVDVTADGRYIAFTSYERLVPADTNDTRDIYVLDRATGAIAMESTASDGWIGKDSNNPDLSDDGRFLVYETQVSGAAEPLNVVLRDRQAPVARILSVGLEGASANGASRTPSISGDGRLVAFSSEATNLTIDADPDGRSANIYAFDVVSGTVQRISTPDVKSSDAFAASVNPVVDAIGRFVAFASSFDRSSDVYVYDTILRTTKRVSVGRNGKRANGGSSSPSISADGRHIAFVSAASNLVTGDDNRMPDVFVSDWQSGSMELISRATKRSSGNDASYAPMISADGRFVAFESEASNLIETGGGDRMDDINLLPDVFLFDRQTTSMTRISQDEMGPWMEASGGPALAATARVVAFSSRHPTGSADRRHDFDLFIVAR